MTSMGIRMTSNDIARNTLTVRVFNVKGRKGKFAFTADVAAWLEKLKSDGA